jgi:hypothetical protein
MRTAEQKRQRKRRNQIIDGIVSGSAMAVPVMFMWLGLVYMFIIELSK